MIAPRRKPSLSGLVAVLLMPLLAAGCAGGAPERPAPPGFSADTFAPAGLISGATATEAGCRALPDAVWADIGSRRGCIRYSPGGTEQPARTAIAFFPGDPAGVSYRFAGGRVHVDNVSDFYQHTAGSRRFVAEMAAGVMPGAPVFLMGRPGMHGSSGDHAQDRHTHEEVLLLDAALTELKRRYGMQDFALAGFSSGGAVVANLLALRNDIRCAVMASAPLDLTQFHRGQGAVVPEHFAMRAGDLADPMRGVGNIRPGATILVLGDTRDRNVPHSTWADWVTAARRQGLSVHVAETLGYDRPELGGGRSYHITGVRALEVAYACATGTPGEALRTALLRGEPILKPQGRRLSGEEIKAAFAGQRLTGTAWSSFGTGAARYTYWGPGGELSHFHPHRPAQRIATHRWWVEGDRLCTSDIGCGEVFADGRFLHLVLGTRRHLGETPYLSTTFVATPPAG